MVQSDGGENDVSGRPTIVFGLDGACFDLIQPWLDDSALPTLKSLIEQGEQSGLDSCVPATTPPAWTSLTTGVNPGKHGVFGFYERERSRYDVSPVSDASVHARRLWDYMSAHDYTSLVVNVPVTHPARELDGALVPGYLAPDDPMTFPETLLEDVGQSEYRVYAESEAADVSEAQLLEEWLALTESRRRLALGLMDRYDWDLLFLEFQKTDGAVHKFDDRAKVRQIFERVDDCMAAVLDAVDREPNVVVVSDHGIGQAKEWSVALNTWLVEEGYAETTVGEDRKPSWLDQAAGAVDGAGEDGPENDGEPSAASRIFETLAAAGLTKQRIERTLTSVGLYDLVVRLAPEGLGEGMRGEIIDKPASEAFYDGIGFSGVDVGVVLNSQTFYDQGIVTAAEYETVRDELIDALESLEGPNGHRPFTRVQRREEVYEGLRTEYAPDIVLKQADDYVIGSQYPRGKTFIPADEGRIDHTRTGLLVAAGPDIESGWTLDRTPSILDVTPTLLHLFEVPLAEQFDGAPLDLLDVEHEPRVGDYEPFEPAAVHEVSADEEAALEERLKSMGYLE